MRFWHVSGEMLFHSSLILSHNSCTPLGGVSYWWSWCWSVPKGVQWDWGQEIGLARILLEYHCLQTTCWPSWRCALDHSPAKSNALPPPSPVSQSFPPDHPLKCSIYLPLNLYQLPHPIPPHTTPYHEVIPPSMLYCWSSCSVRYWFSSLLPYIHLSIRPNSIYLCFIWP